MDILADVILSEEDLQTLYTWVDGIDLSRAKKNISRDFSDAVLMAEVVNAFFPKLVDLHNYSSAHSFSQKKYNWRTLSQKVLKRIDFALSQSDINKLAKPSAGAIETLLHLFRLKVEEMKQNHRSPSTSSVEDGQKHHKSPTNHHSQIHLNNNQLQNHHANNIHKHSSPHRKSELHQPKMRQHNNNNNNNNNKNTRHNIKSSVTDREIAKEKDKHIKALKLTIQALEVKVEKLEKLCMFKDVKIKKLQEKLQQIM